MPLKQDPTHPTGVINTTRKHSPELERARVNKSEAALAMKLGGATWWEIAHALGYPSEDAVIRAVERMLGKRLDTADREHLRSLAAARLESLIRSTWGKAHDTEHPEHLAAVKTTRESIESGARLLGLNAPQEILVTSPTQQHLDEWVAKVVSSNLPEVAEADIVDAEYEEEVG